MTPKYEDRYGERKGKTLEDVYYAVRSVDSKVEEILDEMGELECRAKDDHRDWDMDEYCENENSD